MDFCFVSLIISITLLIITSYSYLTSSYNKNTIDYFQTNTNDNVLKLYDITNESLIHVPNSTLNKCEKSYTWDDTLIPTKCVLSSLPRKPIYENQLKN